MMAVLAALGSALFLAVASVLQHGAARGGEVTLRNVLRRPMWIAGAIIGLLAFGLHVLALASGSLTVVQPLLVTTLLFALPLGWLLERRPVKSADLLAAVAVVAGLLLFQYSAQETIGRGSPDLVELGYCTAAVAVLCGFAVFAAGRDDRRRRAGWLGFCAGAASGVLAALLQATVDELSAGVGTMFSDWPVYAFAVAVCGAIVVNQLAFNAGPLASSLPLVTIVDPIVAVVVGVLAFGETVSSAPLHVIGQLASLLLMSVGIVVLSDGRPRGHPVDDFGSRATSAPRTSSPSDQAKPNSAGDRVLTLSAGRLSQ